MDTTQILLAVVITVLTILLTVIGIQVVFIFKEIRIGLTKVNKMLDDAGAVTGGISKSVTGVTGLMEGFKAGLSLVTRFSKKHQED